VFLSRGLRLAPGIIRLEENRVIDRVPEKSRFAENASFQLLTGRAPIRSGKERENDFSFSAAVAFASLKFSVH
jgi:hypothetical protein